MATVTTGASRTRNRLRQTLAEFDSVMRLVLLVCAIPLLGVKLVFAEVNTNDCAHRSALHQFLESQYSRGHDKDLVKRSLGYTQDSNSLVDSYYSARKSRSAQELRVAFMSGCDADDGNIRSKKNDGRLSADQVVIRIGITQKAVAQRCSGARTVLRTMKALLPLGAAGEVFFGQPMDDSKYQHAVQADLACMKEAFEQVNDEAEKLYLHGTVSVCRAFLDAVGTHLKQWRSEFSTANSLSSVATALDVRRLHSASYCR